MKSWRFAPDARCPTYPERGQIDAGLGGSVIKQQVARPGQGRSGGYRTLVLLQLGQRAVFACALQKVIGVAFEGMS